MLLDFDEAEDVVQEAFARLACSDVTEIDEPVGWLVVVTSRLCFDRLRSRRRRPTQALDAEADRRELAADDPASV
ncbi:MAG: RNA polymerase subunit sigma, partial [Actinomycetota bacterium]|nr:RNA polymerase subunit sigma [Actinomycetota bacterium]